MAFLEQEYLDKVRDPAPTTIESEFVKEENLQFIRRGLRSDSLTVEVPFGLEGTHVVARGYVSVTTDDREPRRGIGTDHHDVVGADVERREWSERSTRLIPSRWVKPNIDGITILNASLQARDIGGHRSTLAGSSTLQQGSRSVGRELIADLPTPLPCRYKGCVTVQLVDRNWNTAIDAGLALDPSSFRVICPFVKHQVLTSMINGHNPGELRLVTRLKLADFADGVSDIAALRDVLEAGGQVRGVRNLHAKVFLFGNSRAAVTSANLTTKGLNGNHEFGCVSDESAFVDACSAYFETMWKAAGTDVTFQQLDDWGNRVSQHLDGGARPGAADGLPDFGTTVNLDENALPALAPRGWPAESSQAFVKFFGEGSNRADLDASTFDEVKRSGCHWACTYPAGKRPRAVEDGDTIFVGRLVGRPNDTMIFGRVIGRKHRPGQDDATPEDVSRRPFKERWPHYVRVHHGQFVAGTMRNGVSLTELMNNLGAESFASTSRNAAAGNGNTDPRLAFRQQAHIKLTSQAATWVTARLEEAFRLHGRVPTDELDQLDWP